MTVYLVGGGWGAPEVYAPFLEVAAEAAAAPPHRLHSGRREGRRSTGERWASVLRAQSACTTVPLLVPVGAHLSLDRFDDVDAVFVCGGLTPAFADALRPAADSLARLPYCGTSAGAAVAAQRALVGGWRSRGLPVCPDQAGEDLDDLTVVQGLGLVPFTVDVHAAQWGTLGRLIAARPDAGLALDEDCLVAWSGEQLHVCGPGGAWLVHADSDVDSDIRVRRLVPGDSLSR